MNVVKIVVIFFMVAKSALSRDFSKYVMEPDEIMARAALCIPSPAIPMPCPKNIKPRKR